MIVEIKEHPLESGGKKVCEFKVNIYELPDNGGTTTHVVLYSKDKEKETYELEDICPPQLAFVASRDLLGTVLTGMEYDKHDLAWFKKAVREVFDYAFASNMQRDLEA